MLGDSGYMLLDMGGPPSVITSKSNCNLCGYLCGLVAYFNKDGSLLKVEPDPSRYPYDASVMHRCPRFASNVEILNHPERINYPLKRVGERGSGKWQRVSWDEALNDIATRLENLKASHGPEALATCIGAPRSIYWPLHRFLNLFGSPNNIGIGHICWNPAIWVHSLTYGWPIEPELDPNLTKCAILWGVNPAASDNSLFWQTVEWFSETDSKLIVIDPRYTKTAARASMWLPVQPGTDGALALALMNIIIEEKLYDHDFVSHYCSGFEQLRERVKDYPPDKVANITGIDSATIVETAHSYATLKPAAIFSGLGIDQSGYNCTQTLRSLAILRAITGNLDEPGAAHLSEMPDFVPESEVELSDRLSLGQREKKLGADRFRLQTYDGYERLSYFTQRHGKRLPARYLTSAHPHLAWQAMIKGKPYPIRALIVMASNPLLSQADTRLVYEAMEGLDLLVVLELFMTPTAMLADYVLPAAGSLEQSVLQTNAGVANIAYGGATALAPLYERRPDFDFWRDLGWRCGQEQHWPWRTLEEALDDIFAPTGLTWKQFCQTGLYSPPHNYQKYKANGFATPSGKVELYSTLLEELGYDPLPAYVHFDDESSVYPLRLITGVRQQPYYASSFRQVKRLRRIRPEPIAEMDATTATQLGLREGEHVWIETSGGRIQHKVGLMKMLPGVVSVEYGWWYPEQPPEKPSLGGVWESNANLLTSANPEVCDPVLGQWSYRTLRCKVYKANGAVE
jgi:thiosulfate reductase/polysulfide reductase chain A